MTQLITYQTFDAGDPKHIHALTTLWNEACGPNLHISDRFVRYNVQPNKGGAQAGRLAFAGEQPPGFVFASTPEGGPAARTPRPGGVHAPAASPDRQRQGVGSALLAWAEQWLVEQGCQGCTVGASLRPFVPGVPLELATMPFFAKHGYVENEIVCDMAADLSVYRQPATLRAIDGAVRPARRGDEPALVAFLQREFPGRWRYECEAFVRTAQARFADYMLLWTERGVDGFCVLTFEDSHQPIERFYPYQLPRPWGQLGSVGVSADRRGRGYGAALVDAGLRRLHDNGVNGCIIDWLVIVDFYARFGFTIHREYRQMHKQLV